MQDYLFKTKPFAHQKDVFLSSRNKEFFALFMEQGTGKSKVIVDTACWLYAQGKIDAVIIVAPNGVHRNWVLNEIPIHTPDWIQYSAAWYNSSPSKDEIKSIDKTIDYDGLKWITMNVEALTTAKGLNFLKNFLLTFATMLVVDESSTIKNHKAIRTKNLLNLSVHARYRRILTGTPITQGPLDLFSQFVFLDSHILRTNSYYAFRNRYAIMKEMRTNGRSFMNVVGYTNLDELMKLIAPHSFRVTKSECLDLPEKLYMKRYVQLSVEQRKLYNQLKKEVVAELNGTTMSAPLALTRLLRLQQIVGGFFVPDADINGVIENTDSEDCITIVPKNNISTAPQSIDSVNPRIESLIELLQETQGKVIIWARFRSEIAAICERIKEEFGQCYVEYHGGVNNDQRGFAVESFQKVPEIRFFIGHVQAGGKGLTLHSAQTVVYYSNDFSLENRLQSEDRAHRIGQVNHVTYVDMIAVNTMDEKIVKVLQNKKSLADLITGDEPIENWL